MEFVYNVNPELDIPIYQQLVDLIRTAIKQGALPFGSRLPTVEKMTEELSVARGTVKRAYDELERAGFIEKTQGRGTFVCYQPANSESRKEQALAAIDSMLDQLEDMGIPAAEINIFLNLKLRERAEQGAYVKVAVVECNPENLSQISEQLRHINGVDIYSFMLDNIKQYPYKLSEDFDLVVTTSSHAEYLENVVSVKKKITPVALRLSAHCLSQIIKLRHGKRVGIISYSERFAELLFNTCGIYAEDIVLSDPLYSASDKEISEYLNDKDVLLVPRFYDKYLSEHASKTVHAFKGELIDCYYEMDEGSLIYLEAKIKRLREKNSI